MCVRVATVLPVPLSVPKTPGDIWMQLNDTKPLPHALVAVQLRSAAHSITACERGLVVCLTFVMGVVCCIWFINNTMHTGRVLWQTVGGWVMQPTIFIQLTEQKRQSTQIAGTRGWTSADRSTKATLTLTVPRSIFKSSTKDLTRPTLEIGIQRTCQFKRQCR